jgi:hypothetical protein
MDTIKLGIVLLRDFLTTAYLALQATDPLPCWVFFNKAADTNATLVHEDMTGIKWRFPRMDGNIREGNTCTETTQYSKQPEASLRNGSDGSCHFYQLETGNTCTTDGTTYTDQSCYGHVGVRVKNVRPNARAHVGWIGLFGLMFHFIIAIQTHSSLRSE